VNGGFNESNAMFLLKNHNFIDYEIHFTMRNAEIEYAGFKNFIEKVFQDPTTSKFLKIGSLKASFESNELYFDLMDLL
jgi:hypothetical protein